LTKIQAAGLRAAPRRIFPLLEKERKKKRQREERKKETGREKEGEKSARKEKSRYECNGIV